MAGKRFPDDLDKAGQVMRGHPRFKVRSEDTHSVRCFRPIIRDKPDDATTSVKTEPAKITTFATHLIK
ncbi:hypothetical protein J6590_056484 [Homalodisca vitripennis]|nr:hypothetical protein J6590_056484 [Homalodisca vitripennis]